MSGVSVSFFCGAIDLLVKAHGNRLASPGQMEAIRSALEGAERAYLDCDREPDPVSPEAEALADLVSQIADPPGGEG